MERRGIVYEIEVDSEVPNALIRKHLKAVIPTTIEFERYGLPEVGKVRLRQLSRGNVVAKPKPAKRSKRRR